MTVSYHVLSGAPQIFGSVCYHAKDSSVDFAAGKSSGIGANNQKHFLLFLTYTSLHCLDAVPVSLCQRRDTYQSKNQSEGKDDTKE